MTFAIKGYGSETDMKLFIRGLFDDTFPTASIEDRHVIITTNGGRAV
jgi:hypothetical protein